MTPETRMETDARDGFVTYDELKGPDLDAARWSPARLRFRQATSTLRSTAMRS